MQQIAISIGKINTNRVKDLISGLKWKGKTRTELKTYLDYITGEFKESSTELTDVFGDCDNIIIEFLNSLYARYNNNITENNFKEFVTEINNFSEGYKYKVVDLRKTEEELKQESKQRETEQKEANEENRKQEEETHKKGLLTTSDKIGLGTTEISKRIKNQLKEFKGCKFSVVKESYSGGSSITISLMESNIKVVKDFKDIPEEAISRCLDNRYTIEQLKKRQEEGYNQLSPVSLREDYNFNKWSNGVFLTEEGHNILKKVVKIADFYNYDNSDMQTDYYDVNFSFSLHIGKYEKPFKRVV